DPIKVEFTFDIFRTTTGKERVQGVLCDFTFAPGPLPVSDVKELVKKVTDARDKRVAEFLPKLDAQRLDPGKRAEALKKHTDQVTAARAGEFGLYVAAGVVVTDYHTQTLEVPGGLFNKLYQDQDSAQAGPDGKRPPSMQVLINLLP